MLKCYSSILCFYQVKQIHSSYKILENYFNFSSSQKCFQNNSGLFSVTNKLQYKLNAAKRARQIYFDFCFQLMKFELSIIQYFPQSESSTFCTQNSAVFIPGIITMQIGKLLIPWKIQLFCQKKLLCIFLLCPSSLLLEKSFSMKWWEYSSNAIY